MENIDRLASRMQRDKAKPKIGVQVWRVVGKNPWRFEIGKIHAEGKNCIIAGHLLSGYKRTVRLGWAGEPTVMTQTEDVIDVGDDVIVIASDNNQIFYVIDKAVKQ